jgi:transcription elongation factor SPT6
LYPHSAFRALKDFDQHFKLYYGRDLDNMQELMRQKRAEEREARRAKNAEKKTRVKKTKTITNDDGEEIEVTDEEDVASDAEDEPDEEEPDPEVLKHAKRNDPYSLFRRYGLSSFMERFGLTAAQFGSNLHDGYQKIEVQQDPNEPLEAAGEYLNEKFTKPEDVLAGAKYMMATEISRDPLVRQVTREAFFERATICVKPTPKGLKEIDESHDCYAMKYLKDKPVRELKEDQWLRLTQAEEQKLITITLGEDIRALSNSQSFLEEAIEFFKHDAYTKSVQEWNALRAQSVEMAFKNMLYPMLRQELRLKLTKEAKDGIIMACRQKLREWIKIGRYTVTYEDEDEDDWDSSHGCRVMGLMYGDGDDVASYAVLVNADGEVGDLLKLDHLLRRKNSWNEREASEKRSAMSSLRSFIAAKRPHCVVIGASDRTALNVQRDVEEIVDDLVHGSEQFPKLGVFLVDDNLAKVYANSKRADQDFRDYPTVLRQAISLARRMQDPLIEFSQLTGSDEEILCLRYHPMQDLLAKEELLDALNIEFINRVNEVGVDINECVVHQHMSNLVQFVGGLGPRKGSALLKTLRQLQSSQRLENRQQLVTLCHMGPKVLINCAGFIKIDTSSLGDSEVYVEVLDGSRIHNEAYEWARKMAVDALEYDEEDGNPANALEEILQEPEKLAELDLDAFAQELERQGFGKKHITLQDIRSELHQMYKDKREPFVPPNQEEVFNMVTKETPHTFHLGKLVQVTVTGFAYKKPEGEELNQAAPIRKGEDNVWQCPFCGQDDFQELTEVWNHFDAGICPGKAVGVKIRLDNGVSGFIPMKNLSDSAVLNPEERVRQGQAIYCRITRVQPERFSVECTCKSSALADKDGEFKPTKDRHYDIDAEKRDTEREVEKQKKKNRHTYIKRVIVHPSFHNIDFKEAERLMAGMDQGDVIIRPSSKGEDRLTVTWKVSDGIYQHIDVREEGKSNAFSLGRSLWIATEEFEDLDEIIARHVNPMAAHARDILSFRYYKDTDGGKREKAEEILRQEKRAYPGKIHYFLSASREFPGKFLLSYMPRTRARHEFVSVTPDGFRFRQQNFDSLGALMKWFKEHFRDPIPGTPFTPGGRTTGRTPYTPGGAITPGAMSLATGTPYGATPTSRLTPGATPSRITPGAMSIASTVSRSSRGPEVENNYKYQSFRR